MQAVLNDVVARRRDRIIAILLSFKERECDQFLPRETQVRFRKLVLDQLNDFAELVTDMMRSLDNGEQSLNELYFEKLEATFRELYVTRIEAKLDSVLDLVEG